MMCFLYHSTFFYALLGLFAKKGKPPAHIAQAEKKKVMKVKMTICLPAVQQHSKRQEQHTSKKYKALYCYYITLIFALHELFKIF